MFSQVTLRRCKPWQAKRRRVRAEEARRLKFLQLEGIGRIDCNQTFHQDINIQEKLEALSKEEKKAIFR